MNAVNWFEIPVANFERAVAFYEKILATRLALDSSFPGMRMALFPGDAVGGCLVEFAESRPHADGVRIYLNGGEDLGPILDRVLLPKLLDLIMRHLQIAPVDDELFSHRVVVIREIHFLHQAHAV